MSWKLELITAIIVHLLSKSLPPNVTEILSSKPQLKSLDFDKSSSLYNEQNLDHQRNNCLAESSLFISFMLSTKVVKIEHALRVESFGKIKNG